MCVCAWCGYPLTTQGPAVAVLSSTGVCCTNGVTDSSGQCCTSGNVDSFGVCDGGDASGQLLVAVQAAVPDGYTAADLADATSTKRVALDAAMVATIAAGTGRAASTIAITGYSLNSSSSSSGSGGGSRLLHRVALPASVPMMDGGVARLRIATVSSSVALPDAVAWYEVPVAGGVEGVKRALVPLSAPMTVQFSLLPTGRPNNLPVSALASLVTVSTSPLVSLLQVQCTCVCVCREFAASVSRDQGGTLALPTPL